MMSTAAFADVAIVHVMEFYSQYRSWLPRALPRSLTPEYPQLQHGNHWHMERAHWIDL